MHGLRLALVLQHFQRLQRSGALCFHLVNARLQILTRFRGGPLEIIELHVQATRLFIYIICLALFRFDRAFDEVQLGA